MRLLGNQDSHLRREEKDYMSKFHRRAFLTILFLSSWSASSASAKPQDAPLSFKVVHVIGMQGVKHNTKGKITVSKDTLEFVNGTNKNDMPTASVQDALTGEDSQRMVGGTVGTLSTFAPYGSGRFLSLFRTKIDTLTITYRDAGGGLHGAIFTLPQGQAALLKKQMVAQGAKTSISVEDEAAQLANSKKAKEKKP
jgi:hypothetical protein